VNHLMNKSVLMYAYFRFTYTSDRWGKTREVEEIILVLYNIYARRF
jgi:hypothetical protein